MAYRYAQGVGCLCVLDLSVADRRESVRGSLSRRSPRPVFRQERLDGDSSRNGPGRGRGAVACPRRSAGAGKLSSQRTIEPMPFVTIPIVLLSLIMGQWGTVVSHETVPTVKPKRCPTWFEHTARFGPGRPHAVAVNDLKAVSVCRYYEDPYSANAPGLPPNNKLASEKVIDHRHTARSLARAFDRLRPYPPQQHGYYPFPQKEMHLCSAEFGGGFYVRFLYSDGRQSSVEVVPSGCPRAVAGKHGHWLLLSGDLHLRLMKIAPLPQEAG